MFCISSSLSSSRLSGAIAIRRRHLDRGDVAIRRQGVEHTPSKTSKFQTSVRSFQFLASAKLRSPAQCGMLSTMLILKSFACKIVLMRGLIVI